MLQFVELCRLCAQKKRNKINLFAQNENTELLINKIMFCLSVHIAKEDMLPKMICCDCQRSIEQFNAFRIKCQKAEERLNKMLSFIFPNNILGTRIKQEYFETDGHESPSLQPSRDLLERDASPSCINLKTVKNVKAEVVEPDNENIYAPNPASSPDLIQILSKEIVNHNNPCDIKQPVIEIISENFIDDCKDRDCGLNEQSELCDAKILCNEYCSEESKVDEDICNEFVTLDINSKSLDPASLIEVKMQETDTECEHQHTTVMNSTKKKVLKKVRKETGSGVNDNLKEKSKSKRKRKDLVESDVEIDKKYLTLAEGEKCDIDFEEMDALIKKKTDPNTRFYCEKCRKAFKSFKCLKKHRTSHENEPHTFICDLCCNNHAKNFEFSSLKCLKSHIERKHLQGNKSSFQCNLCSRALTSRGQLNAHCKKVHDYSGASCLVCGKTFKNKTRLTDHLKVHNEERPFVCEQCGQSFKWNNGLKIHIQSHKQEKNFLCSVCGKKFSAKKNLIEHLNIHAGKRPHVCKHCNATFVQLSAYSKHLYIHNEELKLYRCDKCEKSFSHVYLLKRHKLQHSGLRPYACSICCNSFKSQSDLCTHVKIHQEKRYPCTVCGRKFSRSKTLKDHMVRHTGIKHVCPAPGCGKSYTQRFPLTKHFYKNHPSLIIINRLGGKKAHFRDKVINNQENFPDLDHIRYDYRVKEETIVH